MALTVGVDLGGTNLRAALVDVQRDADGPPRLVSELKLSLGSQTDPDTIADSIAGAVGEVTANATAAAAPVGIGVAGMLDGDTGIIANAPNLGWRDVNLKALLARRLPGRAIALHNDVNAIAYGEFAFGAGRGARDVLTVFVGTGVGGGLVAAGHLVSGASHVAGEIGHVRVIVGDRARLCGCGARGCLEAYAGGQNLELRARGELAAPGAPVSRAVDLAGGHISALHPGHLDEAARGGDAYAVALWDEVAPLLGLVLANAVTLLNPARLVLGGGVLCAHADLKRRALASYAQLVNAPSGQACHIVDAALGDDAGLLGAAALASLAA